MRLSAIDSAMVICFGLAIAVMYGFRMTPRLNAQPTGCSAPLVSRGYSYSNRAPAGYCLVSRGESQDAPEGRGDAGPRTTLRGAL
jgi:hypothetical protein